MKFTKTHIESPKGRQPSVYDQFLPAFENPGDSIQFDEKSEENPEGITRQAGSNIAKRLKLISGGKDFHSFFDVITKKITVRLRYDGEIPIKEGEEQEESEK